MSEPSTELIAYCGLYCGSCKAFVKGRCPGCAKNEKATWCKVRQCCKEKGFAHCAACDTFSDPSLCKANNNFISKLFGFIFGTDRIASLREIRRLGGERYVQAMKDRTKPALKKGEHLPD